MIDGCQLKCKNKTAQKREEKRQKNLNKGILLEKERFDVGESHIYKKRSEKITNKIIYFFIDFLAFKGYDFVVSPFEADS